MKSLLRQFLAGGLSLSAVNLTSKIVNLLILPILTVYLSPEDIGIVAVYLLIISILGMIYNPGIISVTLRLYYDNHESSLVNKVLVGSSSVYLLVVPCCVIFMTIAAGEPVFKRLFHSFGFWPYGFLAVIASMAPQVIRLWSSLTVAQGRAKRVALVSLLRLVVSVILSLILIIRYNEGAQGRIFGLLAGSLVVFSVALYDIYKYSKLQFSLPVIFRTLTMGAPLILSVFSYVVMESSDKYMLEHLVGLQELGIYEIAYTYASVPLLILVGFTQVWQPMYYDNMNKGNNEAIVRLSGYYILILFSLSFLIILYSREFFLFFVNRNFENGIYVIPNVVLGIFFLGLSNLTSSVLTYQKRFKEIGLLALACSIINIVLNYALIVPYGMLGASLATLITYIIYFISLAFRSKRVLKSTIPLRYVYLSIFFLVVGIITVKYIDKIVVSCVLLGLGIKVVFSLLILLIFGLIVYTNQKN